MSDLDARAFAQGAIEERIEKVRTLAAGARAEEVEGVHGLRVASRRLRAALRVVGPLLSPTPLDGHVERARHITRLLGRARELDVMIGLVAVERERAGGPWGDALDVVKAALEAERAKASGACAEAADLAAGMPELAVAQGKNAVALEDWREKKLGKGLKTLWKAERAWQRSGHADALHAVRIAFKKFRYGCEIFAPGVSSLEGVVEELKAVQGLLGDWNDVRMLVHELDALKLQEPSVDAKALVRLAFVHRAEEQLCAFRLEAETFFAKENRRRLAELMQALGADKE